MNNLENIKFEENDFKLCQNDGKIFDKKLDTKPTSFFKDAMRRFKKNKSSVVGAYIIGALLVLSVIVPLLSPYDLSTRPYQKELPAKIFNSGFGFMDGTKDYSNQVYDYVNETVIASVTFSPTAIYDLKTTNVGENFTNTIQEGVYGGSYVVENRSANGSNISFSNQNGFEFSSTDSVTFTIDFEQIANTYGTDAEYEIVLTTATDTIIVQSLTNSTEDVTYNLSNILANNSISAVTNAKISFNMKGNPDSMSYLAFNSFVFETTSTDETLNETLEILSMTDANDKLLNSSKGSKGYWQSTGFTSLYKANIVYASFTYDIYESVFGTVTRVISNNEILNYIDLGYCTYDFNVGPSSFVKLSENCPINSVNSQLNIEFEGETLYSLNSQITAYKYYGYDSMPRFIFGSDSQGRDLFVTVFSGLRTSLFLAILVSAICFTFGLVWGAISGYYGGNIDLAMERFIDILAGVPFMVVITLVILHLGNSVLTMGLALCLTGWIGVAGRTRSQFYRFKGREYILASRTLGAKDRRLIFKHILPNAMGTIITSSILMIPGVIFSEATIAYYGLGLQGSNTLGVILANNQSAINYLPVLILFPATVMSLLMISFNLFGNGLRDSFNTTLKGSE